MSRRVTLVFNEPPLPFGRAEGRWFYVLLKGLVERGHSVTAFAPCAMPGDAARALELFPPGRYDLRCYPRPPRRAFERWAGLLQPSSAIFSPQFRADLEQHLQAGTDVLHLEQIESCWPAVRYADRAIVNLHRLHQIDFSESRGVRWGERLRRAGLMAAERSMLRRLRAITTFTPLLTGEVSRLNPLATVRTIPPGLGLSQYPFQHGGAPDRPPTVGLVGSFDESPSYQAAVRLVTRIWPFLKRRVPEARLVMLGPLARHALSRWCADPAILLDEIPGDDLSPFGQMDVMVYAPNSASGAKVHILEAFALGTPVATTWAGVEGLDALDGTHAGICDYDEGLVDRIARLLNDPAARRRQAVAAWQLVQSAANPEKALRAVEAAHDWLLAEPYHMPIHATDPVRLAAAS
jgi:glycosyltransferase involved in cell wall biosynthesis